MELSRRAVIGGVAVSCAGGVASGVAAAGDGEPPIVDNGSDDRSQNVRIELTVVDESGAPLVEEPVVLRDSGGSLDVRKGRTGPEGRLVFVESVGPSSCNPLAVRLPRRDERIDLGCHDGYTELTETVRVGATSADDSNVATVVANVVDGDGQPVDTTVRLEAIGDPTNSEPTTTGADGRATLRENMGPPPADPLVLHVPEFGVRRRLGRFGGGEHVTETVKVDTGVQAGPVRVVDAVPQGADRVWPVSTDVSRGYCTNANGERKPTTGEGAADWFVWSGCGTWKEYAVDPGEPVYLEASTDGPSLTDARFEVLERRNGSWQTVYEHDDRLGADAERAVRYTPKSARVRVRNRYDGFYMRVYDADGAATPPGQTEGKAPVARSDADDFTLPGVGAAVWGLVLLVGGLLAGAQVAYSRSTPAKQTSDADDDWTEMRTHPDVAETTWSDGDLPEYAVTVDGRRVIARRSGGADPRVSLEAPLKAARPGAGFELVADGDRVAMGSSGPLAPDLPEAVWQRLEGLRAFGTLTVDAGTATVSHELSGEDADALRSPDDLVAQATAVVDVLAAVEDEVLDDPDGGDGE